MIGFFKKGVVTGETIPSTSMPDGLAWHQFSAQGTGLLTVSCDFGLGSPEPIGIINLASNDGPLVVFGMVDQVVLTPSDGAEYDICYRYQEV